MSLIPTDMIPWKIIFQRTRTWNYKSLISPLMITKISCNLGWRKGKKWAKKTILGPLNLLLIVLTLSSEALIGLHWLRIGQMKVLNEEYKYEAVETNAVASKVSAPLSQGNEDIFGENFCHPLAFLCLNMIESLNIVQHQKIELATSFLIRLFFCWNENYLIFLEWEQQYYYPKNFCQRQKNYKSC